MMGKRIWGTLSTFFPPKKEGLLGINIANDRFVHALLRYSTFDELHFFLPNAIFGQSFQELYADSIAKFDGELKFFWREELPEQLQKNEYTVFHFSDQQSFMHDFSYIRNRYGAFPITAFIHSLSYCTSLSSYARFHLGGFGESDALLCSSTPGKEVIGHQLEETARRQNLACTPIQKIVVPLGMEDIALNISKDRARSKLRLPKDGVIALCMGRFSDYDKMDLVPLLQAMRTMPKDGYLVLAGHVQAPKYFEIITLWIQALNLQERVFIFESPAESVKKGLFKASDFFISIADNPQETFGLSLVEAMSAGLALLVSDYNGYKELCTDDVGIRIPTSWSKSESLSSLSPILDGAMLHRHLAQSLALDNRFFRQALLRLFTDSELRIRLGKAARIRFLKHYHTPVVMKKLEDIWDQLKANYQPPPQSKNVMEMDYFHAFSHYPSSWISKSLALQETEFSKWWSYQGVDYPILTGMHPWVRKEWIDWVQERIPCTVEDMEREWTGDKEKLHYILQWMRKQDLLEVP